MRSPDAVRRGWDSVFGYERLAVEPRRREDERRYGLCELKKAPAVMKNLRVDLVVVVIYLQ